MDSPEQRRASRKPVQFEAQLRDRGSSKFAVTVLDISTTGFRAECAFRLHEGTLVWLTLPGMAGLEAHVAWCDGNFLYGFVFTQPLHEAVLDHIVTLAGA
ncbi:MAG: PilZ domain-containing protein [Sphingomonas sp.]|jgi:hypothetical protein